MTFKELQLMFPVGVSRTSLPGSVMSKIVGEIPIAYWNANRKAIMVACRSEYQRVRTYYRGPRREFALNSKKDTARSVVVYGD